MACNANKVVFSLFTCLAMGVFTVTWVNAQVNLPDSPPEPSAIEFADMPGEIAGYTPQSATSKSTVGTITSDVDMFMSVLDFKDVKMQRWFSYLGVDETGLNLGYAVKLGSTYVGISYGGSLIDELTRRITNGDVLTLQKRDEIKKNSSGTSSKPELIDSEGNKIEGITTSENTVGLIFGVGVFGLKLGFASYMEGRETGSEAERSYEQSFESSLKPSLELGWNFPIGSVQTKIALRGAYDMRQYISKTGETFFFTEDAVTINSSFVQKDEYRDFTEPSGGFTLGFGFGLGKNTRGEFDLVGDAAFRMYKSNDQDGVMSAWKITNPVDDAEEEDLTDVTAPEIFDLRVLGNPVFALTSDISDRLAIGARISLAIGYDVFTISQSLDKFTTDDTGKKGTTPGSTVKISNSRLSLTPELGIGAKFTLWPDHFSLHAGCGINLFSYSKSTSDRTTTDFEGEDVETTDTLRILDLPATKITAGLTVNLTSNLAFDLLAVSSGLNIDATKLTMLLTFSK